MFMYKFQEAKFEASWYLNELSRRQFKMHISSAHENLKKFLNLLLWKFRATFAQLTQDFN